MSTSNPYDAGCPKCGATVGKHCWLSDAVQSLTGKTKRQRRATPHQERIDHAAEVHTWARKNRKGA